MQNTGILHYSPYFFYIPTYMHRKFAILCTLALLISLLLEITLFNYTHYATLFTSKRFANTNEYVLDKDSPNILTFENLNTEIASVYINPVFVQGNKQHVRVIWADEESSQRSIDVSVIKDLDFSNYITVTPRGKVSNLSIVFIGNNITVKSVELNKEIPMVIMPIRLIIIFGISLLLLCLLNVEIRKKISYFCFDYLYDKTNFKQRLCFAMLICSMLIFNLFASYSVCGFRDNEILDKWLKMYSHNMTDALLKKQLHLDIEPPKALLEAERPYDHAYRIQKGIYFNNDDVIIDATFYKGKYYSYYGMIPVILLFAPYKLITGNYLPNSIGAFLFASVATILLMLLWKQIVQNYLKKIPYFFFLIGGATLYASSFIPIASTMVYFHIIPQYSALAFTILGTIMLLKAKEKLSMKYLIISSFSFSIAVACRPTSLFWSILIPIVLWDKRKELINTSRYLLAIIIPFLIIGFILAWYNYARFDSPFSFGETYLIMHTNQDMYKQINIIGKIHSLIKTFLFVLFNPPNLDLTFPFISAKISNIPISITNLFHEYESIVGILSFPIMWFLFYIRKVNILKSFIFAGILISLLNIFNLAFVARNWRYIMDFSWIITIGALICAFQLQEREGDMRKVILKAFYSCCTLTLLLVFFLTISHRIYIMGYIFGSGAVILDPKYHYYLARTFGVICNVPWGGY